MMKIIRASVGTQTPTVDLANNKEVFILEQRKIII